MVVVVVVASVVIVVVVVVVVIAVLAVDEVLYPSCHSLFCLGFLLFVFLIVLFHREPRHS